MHSLDTVQLTSRKKRSLSLSPNFHRTSYLKASFKLEEWIIIFKVGMTLKKLIDIYGIAAGMSYLYSNCIIHCFFKAVKYLFWLPKLAIFWHWKYYIAMISGIKCTPIYTAPKVMQNNVYMLFKWRLCIRIHCFRVNDIENAFRRDSKITIKFSKRLLWNRGDLR